jgi:hypothetical protein
MSPGCNLAREARRINESMNLRRRVISWAGASTLVACLGAQSIALSRPRVHRVAPGYEK